MGDLQLEEKDFKKLVCSGRNEGSEGGKDE